MKINKVQNGYQSVANVKCNDGNYHTFRKIYPTSKDARLNYDKDVEAFIDKINKKNNIQVIETMEGNSLQSVCDEYIQNYSLKNRMSSTLKLKATINYRFYTYFKPNTKVDYIFTEESLYNWKYFLINSLKLSSVEVNRTLNLMKNIIDRTIRRGLIQDIQSANKSTLQLETIRVEKNALAKTGDYWTIEEFKAFIDTFKNDDIYKSIFMVFFFCGLRMGELCGLTIGNFNNGTLTIDHQVSNKLGTGSWEICPPKTENAYRVIDLHPSLESLLNGLKSRNRYKSENDFLFFVDKPCSPTSITRHFNEHIEMAKLKKIRIHDLRHSQSVLLSHIDAKISDTYLINRMGHSNIDEDRMTYGHSTSEDKNRVIKYLESLSSIIER